MTSARIGSRAPPPVFLQRNAGRGDLASTMTGVPSHLDVHELLTAQDFVRRLARSLVFDQQRVDDVVQEAWLAAVQRPPQPRARSDRAASGTTSRRRAAVGPAARRAGRTSVRPERVRAVPRRAKSAHRTAAGTRRRERLATADQTEVGYGAASARTALHAPPAHMLRAAARNAFSSRAAIPRSLAHFRR